MRARIASVAHAVVLSCALAIAASMPALAETDEAARCEAAIVSAAGGSVVPQEVLHAISLTETGRASGGRLRPWPWAVNREGQGHWFKTRAEALAFARHSLAEGRKSFDVGCFQINYKYHGHNFPSVEAMFDPEVAGAYAARFLSDLYMESGDWSVAAGAYHSRTPHFAGIYRARFDRIYQTVAGTPLVVADLPEEQATPRPSRMKMRRGPLIIRVARQPEAESAGNPGRVASVRIERTEKTLAGGEPTGEATVAASNAAAQAQRFPAAPSQGPVAAVRSPDAPVVASSRSLPHAVTEPVWEPASGSRYGVR